MWVGTKHGAGKFFSGCKSRDYCATRFAYRTVIPDWRVHLGVQKSGTLRRKKLFVFSD
jgi:hypothetical protein